MIPGDEDKPMSLLERISDEPCDPLPYIDYSIRSYQGALTHWRAMPKSDQTESVAHWLQDFISTLDDLKRKMTRPTREQWLAEHSEERGTGQRDD